MAAFVFGIVGCVAKGWHAPDPVVLAGIFVLGIGAGALANYRRAQERGVGVGRQDCFRAGTVDRRALALAALLGTLTAAASTALAAAMLAPTRALVTASVIGAALMATYPMQPAFFFRLLEKQLDVALDVVSITSRLGARHVAFRSVRGASSRGRVLSLALVDGEACWSFASDELATRFATIITERLRKVEIPAALARRGRSVDRWSQELLSPADYRTGAVGADEAERTLFAATARPDERIGAALALVGLGLRDRVEAATVLFGDPAMRNALRAVVHGRLDEHAVRHIEALPRYRH